MFRVKNNIVFLDCGTLTTQLPRFFRNASHNPEDLKIEKSEALIAVHLSVLFFWDVTLCLWVCSSLLLIGSQGLDDQWSSIPRRWRHYESPKRREQAWLWHSGAFQKTWIFIFAAWNFFSIFIIVSPSFIFV